MTAHPFSAYVRLLGRGKTLSRGLTPEEAEQAMAMILDGEALPEQIGAFLMLLRMKEETGAEIAGFVRATRERLPQPQGPAPDLDWPSYAGKARRPPWHLLAALRLAGAGYRVALHGIDGHTPGRLYAGETLARLGLPPARDLREAESLLAARGFAYLPLDALSPALARLLMLKPVLGLRSAVNTLARGLNPFQAKASLQAAFHPGYVALHRDAALALGDARVWSFGGDGGENERRPEKPCAVAAVENGAARDFILPPMIEAPSEKETPSVEALVALWREGGDPRAEAAVIGTLALALGAMGDEPERARDLWESRDRAQFLPGVPAQARPAPTPMGEVYLVGAGPGEADLLTFRARALIERAQVVLYDRLVDPSILALLPPDAERVYVGKRASHHAVPQEEIGRLLIAFAKQGKRVLRLKGGDPFLFGRGGEEIEMLAGEGVPFQVCPGVTAALGCSAYAGIPLTHRDHAQMCIFVTAAGRAGKLDHDWAALMRPGQTVAIYMGLKEIEAVAADAIRLGVDPATPAAIVDNGARAGQRVVTGALATLAAQAQAAHLRGPTIIIVGSVVTLREKLDWFGRA
jgi:uroporphyrin-III C-methyltransferase